MKKNYIMGVIACAALTMTSCSNDEIGGNNTKQGDPIEFGVYLGRDAKGSRGTIITNDNLTKFGVTAYLGLHNIQEFMYNQEVIKSADGSWTYSPVKYWPTMEYIETGENHISFYAYAPHTNDASDLITLNNKAHTTVTATISLPTGTNADLTKMVDFVATTNHFERKTNGNGVSNKVTFNLKHEMTRINLKAQVSENVYGSTAANKTKVVIRSLKLKSGGEFYTKATYTFPGITKERGTWDEKEKRTQAKTDLDLQSILKWSDDWTISKSKVIDNSIASNNKGIALVGTSAVDLFNTGQYLFLIPAPNETGLTKNSTSATITYDIITEDGNLENGYSKTSATKTVYLPEGIMQQGKAYNLTFTIAVDQVKLDATVEPKWNTDTNSDIDVPYTPDDATPNP